MPRKNEIVACMMEWETKRASGILSPDLHSNDTGEPECILRILAIPTSM